MEREEILAAIAAVPRWRHSIEVAPGIVTPGSPTPRVLRRIGLPQDLSGKTVLDVGCADGFFSFECERRGASRVLAIDDWSSPFVDRPDGFLTAHKILGSQVEYQTADLQTLDAATLGQFDLVLCLGVLYHLRHPLLGLEQLARLTSELLILETEVSAGLLNRPVMEFIESMYHGRDITTWWVPSISCTQQMARSAGFQRVAVTKIYDTRAVFHCYKDRDMLLREVQRAAAEELARAAGRQSGAGRTRPEGLSPDELHGLYQRLVWNRSSDEAQSRRAVPVLSGALRRLTSFLLDGLRALHIRYC